MGEERVIEVPSGMTVHRMMVICFFFGWVLAGLGFVFLGIASYYLIVNMLFAVLINAIIGFTLLLPGLSLAASARRRLGI